MEVFTLDAMQMCELSILFPVVYAYDTPIIWMWHVYILLLLSANFYLEPASGTLQSTRRYRSSQTLLHGSGGDTFLHPPAHEERTERSGSHNNIDLQPGRPVISPEIQVALYTADTLICTILQCTHRKLTLSVHMSTHLSTDMLWMTALKGSANVTLSGRWKHPLKMALPSETDRTNQNVIRQHDKKLLPSAWPLSTDPWWKDPTGTRPVSNEVVTCQWTGPNQNTDAFSTMITFNLRASLLCDG